MSVTMDWASYEGAGPKLYEDFLVPALFAPFADDLVDSADLEPGMRVLDVACGTGALSRAAARRVGATGSVVGIDLSAPMLSVATEHRAEPRMADITYLHGTAEALPALPWPADVALCQQGLQFFDDRHAALLAMGSAVAPGGRVAVSTWAAPAQGTGWPALAEALDRYIGADAGARMLSPFAISDPDELGALLEDAGLRDVAAWQHSRTVHFAARADFARSLVLASPLAQTFADAPVIEQELILAHVTEAVRHCDGGEHELRHRMTTNVATGIVQ
jgi:ubiquinone/menaquinone biosynthesis C-methylase UbiE